MSKILLILTCAIQMINVIAVEPRSRNQKYSCHCLCLSPLSEKSVKCAITKKNPATDDGKWGSGLRRRTRV